MSINQNLNNYSDDADLAWLRSIALGNLFLVLGAVGSLVAVLFGEKIRIEIMGWSMLDVAIGGSILASAVLLAREDKNVIDRRFWQRFGSVACALIGVILFIIVSDRIRDPSLSRPALISFLAIGLTCGPIMWTGSVVRGSSVVIRAYGRVRRGLGFLKIIHIAASIQVVAMVAFFLFFVWGRIEIGGAALAARAMEVVPVFWYLSATTAALVGLVGFVTVCRSSTLGRHGDHHLAGHEVEPSP